MKSQPGPSTAPRRVNAACGSPAVEHIKSQPAQKRDRRVKVEYNLDAAFRTQQGTKSRSAWSCWGHQCLGHLWLLPQLRDHRDGCIAGEYSASAPASLLPDLAASMGWYVVASSSGGCRVSDAAGTASCSTSRQAAATSLSQIHGGDVACHAIRINLRARMCVILQSSPAAACPKNAQPVRISTFQHPSHPGAV